MQRTVLYCAGRSNCFFAWLIVHKRHLATDRRNRGVNEKTVPFLALDMPYGLKSVCQPKTRDPQKNITYVNEAVKTVFGSALPVVVGASIGGNMAMRYASKFPVKALLLVAPARAQEPDLVQVFGQLSFPRL